MQILVKKCRDNAVLPSRETEQSAGADLYACLNAESVCIKPNEIVKIPTGIAIELPFGYAAFLYGRSGLGVNYGITPANCVGVVDADYRGEIIVGLQNNSSESYVVKNGARIAQMVISSVELVKFTEVDNLSVTVRNNGGFGSTG